MNRTKLIHLALALALIASQARADDTEPPRNGLAAKVVVKSKLPLETNDLKYDLVLTNVGKKPVRVCTLCGGVGSGAEGSYQHTSAPDVWKSDRPSDEAFAKHIVTLKAGESVSLPGSLGGYRGEKYTVKLSYQVGKKFAAKHKTWEGKVEAKPVVIHAPKPKEE